MKTIKTFILSSFIVVFCSNASLSGPFTDDLTRCLIINTTDRDKISLINWIWFAMSVHPDIAKNMRSQILHEEKEIADKKVAYMISNLFLEKCKDETSKAFKYEGDEAIGSFKTLGELSMSTLLQNNQVQDRLSDYVKFLHPNLLVIVYVY